MSRYRGRALMKSKPPRWDYMNYAIARRHTHTHIPWIPSREFTRKPRGRGFLLEKRRKKFSRHANGRGSLTRTKKRFARAWLPVVKPVHTKHSIRRTIDDDDARTHFFLFVTSSLFYILVVIVFDENERKFSRRVVLITREGRRKRRRSINGGSASALD